MGHQSSKSPRDLRRSGTPDSEDECCGIGWKEPTPTNHSILSNEYLLETANNDKGCETYAHNDEMVPLNPYSFLIHFQQ